MPRIHINVSRFDNENPAMVAIKNAAEANQDYWEMMQDCDTEFFRPAMDFWVHRLSCISHVRILSGHPQPMWGVFGGVSDPSICVELDAEPSAIIDLKRAAIDFGQQANQQNVHITRSLGHDATQSFSDLLDDHGTLEIAWLATFNSPRDPRTIYSIAESVGITDLSIKSDGMNLLVYTCGNQTRDLPAIPEQFNRLARSLGKTTPVQIGQHQSPRPEPSTTSILSDNVWCMELINYGRERGLNGATHNYEEARQLLLNNQHQ